MNPRIEKLLSDLARQNGCELRFGIGLPIRFYGCLDTESPIAVINADQPQSELIFTILHEIAHKTLHCDRQYRLPMPWFVNRPYENEVLGEKMYLLKRALRRKCGQEWQADMWALYVYSRIGCPGDLKDFLERHPEKNHLMLFLALGTLKDRLTKGFRKLLIAFKAVPQS